jgi:hypothetical protein
MAGEQHRRADGVDRRRDVGVILRDVLAEIRMLVRTQRTAILAQVECEKSEAFRGEALGHVALEEIVGIAMQVKRSAAPRLARRQAHEGRDDRSVIIVRKLQLQRLESGKQRVRPPAAHAWKEPIARVLERGTMGDRLWSARRR